MGGEEEKGGVDDSLSRSARKNPPSICNRPVRFAATNFPRGLQNRPLVACKGSLASCLPARAGMALFLLRREVKSATAATAGRVCDPSTEWIRQADPYSRSWVRWGRLARPSGRVGRPRGYSLSSD